MAVHVTHLHVGFPSIYKVSKKELGASGHGACGVNLLKAYTAPSPPPLSPEMGPRQLALGRLVRLLEATTTAPRLGQTHNTQSREGREGCEARGEWRGRRGKIEVR